MDPLDRTTILGDGRPIRYQDRFFGQPIDTEGLAGNLSVQVTDQHGDFWTRNLVAVLIEQDLRPVAPLPYAAWFPVSRAVLADRPLVTAAAQHTIDRWLRPWTQYQETPWPVMEPFTTLRVLGGLLASVRDFASRTLERIDWEALTTRVRGRIPSNP